MVVFLEIRIPILEQGYQLNMNIIHKMHLYSTVYKNWVICTFYPPPPPPLSPIPEKKKDKMLVKNFLSFLVPKCVLDMPFGCMNFFRVSL